MSHAGAAEPSPVSEPRPAGALIRLAALTYEGVLLFGVVFIFTYALLAVAHWTYPLAGSQRAVLQGVLFFVLGAYFTYQWSRTGQTLAMKSWHLRVVGPGGKPPGARRAALRYLFAWHLVLPGALWTACCGTDGAVDAFVFALGFAGLFFIPPLIDCQRRLLHDRLAATRVVQER